MSQESIHESVSVKIGKQTITFESGQIARQANGSVVLRCGETMLMSTACASDKPLEGVDFLPLRVDYQEKFSSIGKTLSGFIKREGRPSEREILGSRLIDRPLRPLFDEGYFNEIQVLTFVYSYDGINTPDVLAICAASCALTISDIPLKKPIGGVRVGYINNEFVINPSKEELKTSQLDLILAGSEDAILMIEGYCDFLSENQVIDAIELGHESIKELCIAQHELRKKIGKAKKRELHIVSKDVTENIEKLGKNKIQEALQIVSKQQRDEALNTISEEIINELNPDAQSPVYELRDLKYAIKKLKASLMRNTILKDKIRIDGRKLDEIRKISVQPRFLPRTHGSALFTRGETQSLAVCTLGGETMAQRYEDLHGEGASRFYMQYFFPPFSVGEVGRMGPPGRREIGHGKLAERALSAILPEQATFPYVMRLESNITESNGSSSMASVCGGCIAMMDAGVPIKRPVSGIAMGLILEGDQFEILSDILGTEDALGDMDFKITGDKDGITAFQMDIKVEGITSSIMRAALDQAKKGRIHILNEMLKVCPESQEKLSIYAPKIDTVQIKQNQIGTLIGPGGKNIRAITEDTGVQIDISDEGLVSIASTDSDAIEKAKEMIINLTGDVEIGKIYNGRIKTITDFGLFVEIYSKQGLCHKSEVSHTEIKNLNDFFKIGDKIDVKVLHINDRGQIKLSHKALLANQV
jgi:polyribonucleotide nucleotidyltransferase